MKVKMEKEYKIRWQSGRTSYLLGPPAKLRELLEGEETAVDYMPDDPDTPDRIKWMRIHRVVVHDEDKTCTLNPSGTKSFLKEKYFIGKCSCRPLINEVTSSLFICGEDDCSVHGFGED